MRFAWQIALGLAVFALAVGGVVWLALSDLEKPPRPSGYKSLSGTVAEDLELRDGKEPFPRLSCAAVRVGKLKAGPFSLGAFSTVEIDDLVVNAPEGNNAAKSEAAREPPSASAPARASSSERLMEVVDALHLKSLISLRTKKMRRLAGIQINGLRLNRMEGASLVPILKARCLKSVRERIALLDVELFDGSSARQTIPEATLELKPAPRLVWTRGALDLRPFLESLR